MNLLRHAATLNLEHWAISAGTVRSAVWDSLHGYDKKTLPSDVDFIFMKLPKMWKRTGAPTSHLEQKMLTKIAQNQVAHRVVLY